MNKTQKGILLVVIGVIVAMFLYQPFMREYEGSIYNCGYQFLLYELYKPSRVSCLVNTPLLLTQLIGVLIVGAIAYFIAKGEPRK